MKRGKLLIQLAKRFKRDETREVVREPLKPPSAAAAPAPAPAILPRDNQKHQKYIQERRVNETVTNDNLQVIEELLPPLIPPTLPTKVNDVGVQEESEIVEILEPEDVRENLPSLYNLQNIESCENDYMNEDQINSPTDDFSASDTDDDYQPAPTQVESSTDSDVSTSVRPQNSVLEQVDNNNDEPRRSQKRSRNEKNWETNKKKAVVNSGQPYVTGSGRQKRAKAVKISCGQKCKLKCSETFTDEQRQTIFDNFHKMSNRTHQRHFMSKCMQVTTPRKYRREGATRKLNYAYYFYLDNTKKRVCKTFFKNTLDITNSAITTIQNMTDTEGFTENECRGKHSNHKSLSDAEKQSVRDYINSFPRIESHYCRADTKREFLEGDLTISTMYRLYIEYCKDKRLKPVKDSVYAQIFNTEFNIGFFKPKKDQCSKCESFKNASPEEKLALQDNYDKHISEKNLSRDVKKRDVDKAKNSNGTISIFDYDLQAVVTLPQGEVSTFVYKSKLNLINFTVCDCNKKDGICYAWHEGIAKRGANEIGSCVYMLLEELGPKSEVIFYSDNCGGQNKNKFILSMYMYAVQTLPIDIITHIFLITVHTQNYADNIHSVIERERRRLLKGGPIFTPAQMAMVLKSAKKSGKPYTVHELSYDQIYDWKKVSLIGKNFNIDENGKKIVWGDIKCIQVTKSNTYKFGYKSSFAEDGFVIVNTRRKQRGRVPDSITLEKAYSQPPAISNHKKKDLISLCTAKLIPQCHHSFFEGLKACNEVNETEDSD